MNTYEIISGIIATTTTAGGFFYSQDELSDWRNLLGFSLGALIVWPLAYFLWPLFFIVPCVRRMWPKDGLSGFFKTKSFKNDAFLHHF